MSLGAISEDEDEGKIHVYPLGDLREHVMSCDCWCKPEADVEDPEVIIHNSADERETLENGSATFH